METTLPIDLPDLRPELFAIVQWAAPLVPGIGFYIGTQNVPVSAAAGVPAGLLNKVQGVVSVVFSGS